MTILACPHCNEIIDIFGEPLAHECECGGLMEVFEDHSVDHDRAAEEIDRAAAEVVESGEKG